MTATLDDFAADALDWPAVREVLARHVWSSLGRRALAELAPRAADDARAQLARVGELAAYEGDAPPLGGLTDPAPSLSSSRDQGRSLSPEELAGLAGFLRSASSLAAWLLERAEALPTCAELSGRVPDLAPLRQVLDAAVDGRGRVLDGASARLAGIRQEARELEQTISRVVQRAAKRPDVRKWLTDGSVHLRGGRACLAVQAKQLGRVPGVVHDKSQSGETVFVEPHEVVEPANRLSSLRADEQAEVARVLAELTRAVLEQEAPIRAAAAALAELELAAVGSAWAREVGGRSALQPGDPGAADELLLRAFRHPLLVAQEAAGALTCVPIDVRLGRDFDLLVVTGPNTGGKTLALKSAGLAALLTRLGLPVAADAGTTVPLYDGVVADIGDEQEVQQSLSTFSSHLVRISAGLACATPRTLVLLDELGGGTDPDEGGALGDALLEALLRRGAPTLATTHIGRLKEFAFRHARAENACAEFDLETLRPTYELVLGTPGESRALAIARRLGLDAEVVDAAEARLQRSEREVDALMEDVRSSRVEAERLRGEADARLADLEAARGEVETTREAVERERALVEVEAERGVETRLADLARVVHRAEALLPQLPGAAREGMAGLFEEMRAALASDAVGEARQAFLEGLKKGEMVYLPKFNRRCVVHKVHKGRREVTVQLGTKRMTVPFEDVSAYEAL